MLRPEPRKVSGLRQRRWRLFSIKTFRSSSTRPFEDCAEDHERLTMALARDILGRAEA
jgi:hypothetical protein